MPYSPHPCFALPDAREVVRRYMSVDYAVELLRTSRLYFARADKMVDDPLEGLPPIANVELDERQYREVAAAISADHPHLGFDSGEFTRRNKVRSDEIDRTLTRGTFLSCWSIGLAESPDLWRKFGADGVSVVTTVGRLCESFVDDAAVHVGTVQLQERCGPHPNWEPVLALRKQTKQVRLRERVASLGSAVEVQRDGGPGRPCEGTR